MKLHELKPYYGSKKKRKIVGRGVGSGHGRTATRGSKGQRARSGDGKMVGFEGGQMPLIRRIPKRGFTNKVFKKEYSVFNIGWICEAFEEASDITPAVLAQRGYAKKGALVKILSDGDIKRPLTIKAHAFSKGAVEKIQKAGGKCETIKS